MNTVKKVQLEKAKCNALFSSHVYKGAVSDLQLLPTLTANTSDQVCGKWLQKLMILGWTTIQPQLKPPTLTHSWIYQTIPSISQYISSNKLMSGLARYKETLKNKTTEERSMISPPICMVLSLSAHCTIVTILHLGLTWQL